LFSLLSVGFRALGEQVGLPGGFGHAIAFAAGQGELDGLGQINLVADRDEDRLDAVPGANDRADHTALVVIEIGGRSADLLPLPERPQQERFRAADRRPIQDHTDVAGDARRPRMRQAMAVHEDQVRSMLELAEGLRQPWCFPERQEAGDVRKGRLLLVDDGLQDRQFRKGEHDDAGVRDITDEGHVRAGDQAGRGNLAARVDLGPELLLDLDRFFGRDIPGVEVVDLHGLGPFII